MKKLLLACVIQIITVAFAFSQGLSLPYYSGYDSPTELAGWQEFRTGFLSSYSWGIGGSGFSGVCLSHDYNVGGSANETVIDWYVSPPLNISGPAKISLKVHTSGFSTPTPDNCEVWFGTGNPDPGIGNFGQIGNLSYMLPQYTWLDTTFSISLATDSGYIAIKYKTIGAAWATYRIDNITVSLDSSVGIINNENFNSSLSIYPNPFSTAAIISFNKKLINSSANIKMYDSFGRIVKQFTEVTNEIIINREELECGIYFIDVIQNNKTIAHRKVVIQ